MTQATVAKTIDALSVLTEAVEGAGTQGLPASEAFGRLMALGVRPNAFRQMVAILKAEGLAFVQPGRAERICWKGV